MSSQSHRDAVCFTDVVPMCLFSHKTMKETTISIQTTPPHGEIYALPFNENFCVQFMHIMKHYVLYLWVLNLCFVFRLLGRCHGALGGGNDMAIDDPSRDLCVFVSFLMAFSETFARTTEIVSFPLPATCRQSITYKHSTIEFRRSFFIHVLIFFYEKL